MKFPLMVTGGCLTAAMITSCAALKTTADDARKRTGEIVSNARMPGLIDTPFARLLPAGGLKIVEPRAEDLQKMPSGEEQAIAYRKESRRKFSFFGGPVDFQEPPLPDPGTGMDGSLLPPRTP